MNQTIKVIAIGVIVASLLGLCLVGGGIALYVAIAENARVAVWDPVVFEKDRLREKMYEDLNEMKSRNNGKITANARRAFIKRAEERDERVAELIASNPRFQGKMPPAVGKKFGESLMTEAMLALAEVDRNVPKPATKTETAVAKNLPRDQKFKPIEVSAEREAERQAIARQAMAKQKIEAERIWHEIESYYAVPGQPGVRRMLSQHQEAVILKMRAIESRLRSVHQEGNRFDVALADFAKFQQQMIDIEEAELERERLAAAHELREQQRRAREEAQRKLAAQHQQEEEERLAALALKTPPPAISTAVTNEQPGESDPDDPFGTPMPEGPSGEPTSTTNPQQPSAPLPGFPVAEASQLQAGSKVLVRVQDKWYAATIQGKRGKNFDVRYVAGDPAVVPPERIRWQHDPAAQD